MKEEIYNHLKKLISTHLGVDENDIELHSDLKNDLNADPIAIGDLIVAIENEFNISIPQEVSIKFFTVEAILYFVSEQTGEI
jgi:acyl carrier protein